MLAGITRCILEDIPWVNVILLDVSLWLKKKPKHPWLMPSNSRLQLKSKF